MTSRKKIYFLNNVYPTAENPRLGTYARSMAEEMRAAGHEVDVDAMFFKSANKGLEKLRMYARFWKHLLLKNLKGYDIVYINHFTYCFPILFNRSLRKAGKVYIHWHGKELLRTSAFDRHTVRLFNRRLRKYSHISPSQFFKGRILRHTSLNADSIMVSPSGGVDTDVFTPIEGASDSGRLVIGFPGEIKTTKGADILFALMERHEDIERLTGRKPLFSFIAYGPELEMYIERFGTTGAQFEMSPKMSKEEMPRFYRQLDVALVLSSAVVGESLGLVALEAMSCGVPVIAHDICAFPEFVSGGISGELVPYSDNVSQRSKGVFEAVVKVANHLDTYNPRGVILDDYSHRSVINFYKSL